MTSAEPSQPSNVVTAIVPAYREEARIGATVRALRAIPAVGDVLVVDDGSTDRTASVAREAGATVLSLPRRRGKAGAMEAGLRAASLPYVAFVDGDVGASAEHIATLITPVLAGDADVAIALMPLEGGPRGFGLVTGLSRWAARRYGGLTLQSAICGQRVMSRETALKLLPFGRGYAVETRCAIIFGRLGLKVVEAPVPMEHRRTGRDLRGLLHRARQFAHVLEETARWTLWRGRQRDGEDRRTWPSA